LGQDKLFLSYAQSPTGTRTAILSSSLITTDSSYTYNFPNKGGTFAMTSDVTGAVSGTTNYIPKFTSSTAIGNSVIYESSSNIGIGTITPATKLHVASTGNTFVTIDGGASNNTGVTFYKGGSAAGAIYYLGASDAMRFDINNTEQMRLTSTGLGIGTSSPAYKLDVAGNTRVGGSGNPSLTISGTDGAYTGLFYINAAGGGASKIFANGGTNTLQLGTNNTERLTLNSSGNLGLSVTPSAWQFGKAFELNYVGNGLWNNGVNDLTLVSNVYYNAGFKYGSNGYATKFNTYNGTFEWHTAASGTAGNAISFTQAMTLDASGNLALGTTASLSSAANRVDLTINGSSTSMLTFGVNGTRRAYLISNGTDLTLSNTVSGATIFSTNDTERMRITSGGNVGIGVSSPNTQLQINGTPSNDWGNLTLFDTRSQAADRGGMISFGGYKSTTSTEALFAQIKGNKENGTSGNEAGYLAFFTNNNTTYAERMRITSSGQVAINDVSAGTDYKLKIKGNTWILSENNTSAYFPLIVQNSDATNLLYVRADNGAAYVGTAAWTYGSDLRLKENISYLSVGLDKIMELKPTKFDYKKGTKNNIGFIAQEVQSVIPEAVSIIDDKTGYLGLKTDFIVPYLVKAIQELKAEIETLKNK
jgi:hypothetical protein